MENTLENEENTFYTVQNESFISKPLLPDNMDVRTIVKSGKASYTVAIPKDWIERNKLKKGDKLYIEEKGDNELVVSTKYQASTVQQKEFVINIDNKEQHCIHRELVSAYLNPYSIIVLRGKDLPKHIDFIKKEIAGLFALEIVDESSTKIVADSFIDIKTVSLDKLTRRIDNITRSMVLDTINMVTGDDIHELIVNRDFDVNRITFLILKIIKTAFTDPSVKQALHISNLEALGYWELQIRIEKIADQAKRIARILSIVKKKKNADLPGLKKLIEMIYQEYCTTMTLYYTKKSECAVMLRRGELVDACDDYFTKNRTIEIAQITAKLKAMLSDIVDIHRLTRNLYAGVGY
jgi:phosphate uptake regulator